MIDASAQFYTTMRTRRSVRHFSNQPVPEQVIRNALLAAGTAPSGANLQPWHFAITTDPEVKCRLRALAEEEERNFYTHRASDEWLQALAPLGTDADKPFLEVALACLCLLSSQLKHNKLTLVVRSRSTR